MIEGLKEVEGFVHSLLRAFHGMIEQEQIIEYKGAKIKVTIEVLEKYHIEDLKPNERGKKTEILDEINEEIKKEEQDEYKGYFSQKAEQWNSEDDGESWLPKKEQDELLEILAKYVHDDNWSDWMKHQFSMMVIEHKGEIVTKNYEWVDATRLTLSLSDYERWKRQMNTIYEDLPEEEKKSDREIAEKLFVILEKSGYEIVKKEEKTSFISSWCTKCGLQRDTKPTRQDTEYKYFIHYCTQCGEELSKRWYE